MRRGDGGRNLYDTRIKIPGEGIDLTKRIELDRKFGATDRIGIGIKALVGACRSIRERSAAGAHCQPRRFDRAGQRSIGNFRGMRIARDLAQNRTQAKAFGGIVAGGFHAPIVKHQRFGTPAFDEQFTIISTICRCTKPGQSHIAVNRGFERAEGIFVHGGLFCADRDEFFDVNQKKRPFAAMVILVC